MAKAVVYTVLATTFILLIACFQKIETNHEEDHSDPRSLSRRMGFKIPPPISFDPLVVKMERLAKEKDSDDWKTSPTTTTTNQEDMERYLSDEGRLNITQRLIYLFPFLDNAPKDGFVESKELEAWITQQVNNRLNYQTEKELALRDRDGDGAISFREYFPRFSNEDLARNGMEHGDTGWWKEQFKNADIDLSGILNFYEFRDFLHPEDSNNEQIHKWLLREKIKSIDHDHDEKLNFLEFKNGAYDIYKNYVAFETGGTDVPFPEDVFAKLDVDHDKFLSIEELKSIFQYLSPGEFSYAKYYASYLIHEADDNGDGKLTLDEMIRHEQKFYSTVYEDDIFDDDDYLHEEL